MCTGVVCLTSKARATKTPVQQSPVPLTCIEFYFFNGVSETRRTLIMYTLIMDKIRRLEAGAGGGVLSAHSYEKRARLTLICAVKQLLRAGKTSTKKRVSHTPLKNNIV